MQLASGDESNIGTGGDIQNENGVCLYFDDSINYMEQSSS
jgi:hypothetical protein